MWRRTLAAAIVLVTAAVAAIFFWWQAARAFDELKSSKEAYVKMVITFAKRLIDEYRGEAGLAFSFQTDTLLHIRESLREIDAALYGEMQARYYPDMVLAPGGTFKMGCKKRPGQNCPNYESVHTVSLDSFWIARTETTVWQYFLHTKASKSKEQPRGAGNEPVAFASWFDAVEYANWVSKQLGKEEAIGQKGNVYQVNLRSPGYRLPTEAEWEYAAKGGRQHQGFVYSGSDDLKSVGWYDGNSDLEAHPVAKKGPNELGLYDMSGNLWEWCWDWSDRAYYNNSPRKNPPGPDSGTLRVLRGGSWGYPQKEASCFHRDKDLPSGGGQDYGFRLARAAGIE